MVLGVGGVTATIALWALANHERWVDPEALPGPAIVGRRAIDLLGNSHFWGALGNTLLTWLLGMAIATAVAVPVGLVIGWFPSLHRPAEALISSFRSMPVTALVPVAILLLGLGVRMKTALVIFAILWPILLNAIYGVRAVEFTALQVGRSLRWSRTRILTRIVLPSAASYIASGLRIATGIALIVTFSAELLGASNGVGTLIVAYQEIPEPGYVYAGIVIVGFTGMLLYGMVSLLERKCLPWSVASRKLRR